MITIEASNIYLGGGFVLLEEFLRQLEQRALPTRVYVGYEVVFDRLTEHCYNNIDILKSSPLGTLCRYMRKGTNTLFFCSLPPFVKYKSSVVYFHNPYFASRPHFSIGRLKYIAYHYWVKIFKNKVDFFACQTQNISTQLSDIGCNVKSMPFYIAVQKRELPKIYDFCYISTVSSHKNHKRLFEAIETLVDSGKKLRFAVTIRDTEQNSELTTKIAQINKKAAEEVIVNLGFVNRQGVEEMLNSSKAVFFPSLTETFGLPIAEAMSCGVKVIASNRAYATDLIDNPILFDPEDIGSMTSAMNDELDGKNEDVSQSLNIDDKLNELISFLAK